MQMICTGLGKIITNDSPITGMPPQMEILGTTFIGGSKYGIPSSILIMILMYIIFSFIAQRTKLGRNFYAMGGGEEAAYFAGIDIKKNRFYVYTIAGGLAALSSLTLLVRLDSAAITNGSGYEFDAMIGCVIAGISLAGGKGKIVQALLGTIFLTLFFNGMTMLNVHPFIQNVLKGMVLIAAVALDVVRNKQHE
jgi:ribose/xylose/arabinose/galactoside ABC-type transport system permease subunit